jgi:hypothetical protein
MSAPWGAQATTDVSVLASKVQNISAIEKIIKKIFCQFRVL